MQIETCRWHSQGRTWERPSPLKWGRQRRYGDCDSSQNMSSLWWQSVDRRASLRQEKRKSVKGALLNWMIQSPLAVEVPGLTGPEAVGGVRWRRIAVVESDGFSLSKSFLVCLSGAAGGWKRRKEPKGEMKSPNVWSRTRVWSRRKDRK